MTLEPLRRVMPKPSSEDLEAFLRQQDAADL